MRASRHPTHELHPEVVRLTDALVMRNIYPGKVIAQLATVEDRRHVADLSNLLCEAVTLGAPHDFFTEILPSFLDQFESVARGLRCITEKALHRNSRGGPAGRSSRSWLVAWLPSIDPHIEQNRSKTPYRHFIR